MLRKQHLLSQYVRYFSSSASNAASSKDGYIKEESKPAKPKLQPSPIVEVPYQSTITPGFLSRIVGASYRKCSLMLDKNPKLKSLKQKDIQQTTELLRKLNYTVDEICSKPMILYYNIITLENRLEVMQECGFQTITVPLLYKYVTVMNKSVGYHKTIGTIAGDTNVLEKLQQCLDSLKLKLPASLNWSSHELWTLKVLRQNLLNCYLQQRLEMGNSELDKMWRVYPRVRHKSFRSVQAIVDLLLDELKFPKERIHKNAFLIYADANNVRRILNEIPAIDNTTIRDLVYKRPKVLMSSCDALLKTLQHVKTYGIDEDAVLRCIEVLTLGPDTVQERLRDLHEIEEFSVLETNPRVLRLVHYQNKAKLRLEYLNQLKVRCASLHILSCGSDSFARFARDGSDRTKGCDIVIFLSKVMQKDENSLRASISRQPNWCHIPVIHVKQCYEYLISKKFFNEDIYQNIQILLYPIKRIEEKLLQLQSPEFLAELKQRNKNMSDDLSNDDILSLILYMIESEFHFTGDGIWSEQHILHVENFNNLLPDFPESLNKVYKYGMQPTDKQSIFSKHL